MNLFDFEENSKHDWKNEWLDMPEYINNKPVAPEITALFKFRNKNDFDAFMEVVKSNLYNNLGVS